LYINARNIVKWLSQTPSLQRVATALTALCNKCMKVAEKGLHALKNAMSDRNTATDDSLLQLAELATRGELLLSRNTVASFLLAVYV
jgi:hypothetical protein